MKHIDEIEVLCPASVLVGGKLMEVEQGEVLVVTDDDQLVGEGFITPAAAFNLLQREVARATEINPMKQTTRGEADVKQEAKDVFARIGTDITGSINAAVAARMEFLLPPPPAAQGSVPLERRIARMEIVGGMIAAGRLGTPEADLSALGDFLSQPRTDAAPSANVLAAGKKVTRAGRLFRHMVTIGCFRRGEVSGVEAGNWTTSPLE